MSYLVVIGPLGAGGAERARQLLAQGPLLDLEGTAFSWERGNPSPEISFDTTPGAGDSEGGDVFSP